MKRIYYFSHAKDTPPRDIVYLEGLVQNGIEIIECKDSSSSWKKFLALYKKHKKIKRDYGLILVGYSGHTLVPFVKLISNKKIIFNALGSLYEGKVVSRGQNWL